MKLTWLTTFLFISILSYSQDSTFTLKDYIYRTPGFRALIIDFGLSGSISDSKSSGATGASVSNFSLSPSVIRYNKVVSTDSRLHQSTLSLLQSWYLYKAKSGLQEEKSGSSNTVLSWQRSDRFYKNKLWFFEFGNDLQASRTGQHSKGASSDYKQNNLIVENTMSFGIGKGRIERVQDAQMALYILNDLKKQGLLDVEATPALTNAFARLITEINNRRVFDSRRRRIYELTTIDSFLRVSGLVNKTDIRHFTTVNDNWAFAFNPYRMAGSAWFARLKPGIRYSRIHSNQYSTPISSGKEDIFTLSVTPEIGFEKYVPVNLKWQQNVGASIDYALQRYRDNQKVETTAGSSEFNKKENLWDAELTAFWGLGFFPNTRTQLSSNLFATFRYSKSKVFQASPGLNLSANYFIGYRTYLTASGNIIFNAVNSPSSGNYRYFGSSFNVTFSHILF